MPLSRVPTAQLTGALSFRNRIINGDMRIDQRNNGASVTANSASSVFAVDRFNTNVGSVAMAFSCQQIADAPAGFTNSLKITVTTPGTPTAGQFTFSRQVIEGNNIADLAWGTSSAVPVTVSAWVKASITGTYSAFLINHAEDRSYVGTFTVNTANTWEQKSFTVPGDTAGTWLTNNSNGIRFGFDLGSGSNFQGTANAWNTGWKQRTSGTVSFCQTSGATFQYTGVQLEAGTVATPFERRDYGRELMMCQRYYEVVGNGASGTLNSGNAGTVSFTTFWKVTKRAGPTVGVGFGAVQGADIASAVTYQGGIGAGAWYFPQGVTASAEL